ncbi:MAG: pyrroline-5-carboxylate reductase [Gammaproteobacteria bacterium]|nr:pyrroline-5-carboxylate reductase [Gammaproteobacteria bacterium]
MNHPSISFIGGGNMARCLIGGLLRDGYPASALHVADPNEDTCTSLRDDLGITASTDNSAAAGRADVVVLAVKPQVMAEVARGIAATLQQRRPLIISVAAGIRIAALERWLGQGLPIVRAMPNTPALVGAGASALYANHRVSDGQRSQAESILRASGIVLWLDDERLMDAVTALSGSGPAYFFLVIEALEAAGRRLGLPAATARLLTLQTAFGAAKMALESTLDSTELRRRVTSPGGTTERAIDVLEQHEIHALFDEALQAACRRSAELAETLGQHHD